MANRTGEVLPVRWGATWSGAVTAVALFSVFSVLWLALAYGGTGSDYFRLNLHWYLGGTALIAWYLGGVMTGRVGGMAALSSATAMWALTVLGALIVLVPLLLVYLAPGTGSARLADISGYSFWITFASAVLGLATSWLGASLAVGGRRALQERSYPQERARGDHMMSGSTAMPPSPRTEQNPYPVSEPRR
jgi:hypothetical protein